MKHSSSLAIWLGLGAAFLGLLTTFFAVWAARRKKAADNSAQLSSPQAQEGLGRPNQ